MTSATGQSFWVKEDPEKDEEEIPNVCENPDENCRRTPEEIVKYAVARRPDSVWEEFYLCSPCAAMFYRGTTAPRDRIEIRKINDE